jgi:hypothetical protein
MILRMPTRNHIIPRCPPAGESGATPPTRRAAAFREKTSQVGALPLSSRPGGFGRNSLATSNQVQFDLRLLKFFRVGEHGKLDFVVESFNLLNHTNVIALNQFYGAESSPLPAFATPNKAGIPRHLQFSIDFEF